MRLMFLALSLIAANTFAQEEKSGTIHVKKSPEVRIATDTIVAGFDGPTSLLSRKIIISPQYRGGDADLKKFISANIRYPARVREKKVSGTCYTSFIINSDGRLSDISIVKGVDTCPECNEEALRVIQLMDQWIPGTRDGQKASMEYRLAVEFRVK